VIGFQWFVGVPQYWPPQALAKLSPNARRAALEAQATADAFRLAVAEHRAKLDRAPLEAARAVASSRAKAAERAEVDDQLRRILGKSHGILRDLTAGRR
jgi:hypothetical protein